MTMTMRIVALLAVLSVTQWVQAEDWPQWRGPQGDGIIRNEQLLETWPDDFKPLWSAQVGQGYAAPVVKDGRVYLFTMLDRKDTLVCFDAANGKELWKESYDGGWTGQYPGTRATPTIVGDRIYTFGGGGDLVARELASGKQIWRLNVLKETKAGNLVWGCASTPLVIGDAVYVQGGQGGAVAVRVNAADGTIKWSSQDKGLGSYAPIVLIDVQGTKQLIVFAGKELLAMNPDDGATIWREPWETSYDVNAATPIYQDSHLFVTSGYGHGSMMLQLTANSAKRLWEIKKVQSRMSSPVLDSGYLYCPSEDGMVRCLKWPEQAIVWEAKERELRLGMGGSFVRWQDKLIALSESGVASLIRATPEKAEKISQFKPFQAREVWTVPVVAEGKLYLNGGGQFVCFDVSKK